MNPEELPLPGGATGEVSALIETLVKTGRRLEDLTAGEVDTVTSRDGRTVMLRRAQDQVRHSESARQSAILNALPAHIALLDSEGGVVSMNEVWRQFAGANPLQGPGCGIGVNYLELCDRALAEGMPGAREAAAGVRSVLSGAATSFSIEYACHSPVAQRWFLLTVTPLALDRPNGAVVMHLDITERKRGEEGLQRFGAALDALGDAIYLVDRSSMRFIHVNDAACRMQSRTREELLALGPDGVLSTSRADLERTYDAMIASGVAAEPVEMQRMRQDGSQVWIELRRHAQRTGDRWTIVSLVRDVTERRQAEAKIVRLNRVYAVLSGINTAIVRIREREELFREVCRIAVAEGGFRLARVLEVDANAKVRITASSEPNSELFQRIVDEYNSDPEHSQSLLALAMRERQPVISNDVAADARMPHRAALTKDGNFALALLPIIVEQRIAGTVMLRTREAGTFDEAELHLLRELVSNLSFALEHMEKERKVQGLTRVHAVLSGINTLIVRVKDRDELFREACRIAVEAGHFLKAWLGIAGRGSQPFRVVAAEGGDPVFFQHLERELANKLLTGKGLVARALATREPVISNDSVADPEVLLNEDIVPTGVRSIAVLPLVVAGEAVGVLTLNADAPGFFDEEEMKLLVELAGDIAFAIDHIEKQERLDYLAYYDVLTGLANRSLFLERVAQYMRSAVSGGHKLALFLVDLERFKNINDSFGQPAGDALLRQVAEWLIHSLGDASLIARLGADHFAVVLPEVKLEGNITRLLENTMGTFLDHPFRLNDAVFRIAAKVGVALFPDDAADADTLLKNAEVALKKAKASGDRYLFYAQKMTEAVAGNVTMENQLRQALDNEEFVLHYQPKMDFKGKVTGAEALIRWNDPRTGLVPPGQFIPILEETGLIREVGRWALRKAIEDYLRWRAAGLPAVRIAVNVSPLQLHSRGFIAEVQEAIAIDPLAAAGLELEITESVIMEDIKHNIASLQAIRAMGVTIAIDDFGTGFSSLSYLARLPLDTLKIDRSFVIDMTGGPQGLALVSTIIGLAHALNLKVVAEGVETEEQSRLLRLLKCDEMQGFLFCKPVPGEVFEARFLAQPAAGVVPSTIAETT
jgi:diguanylate cyclase (GGDEF)-like protein/PAS domain S-box-containing protein